MFLVFNLLKGCNKLNSHPVTKESLINLQAYLHYKMFILYKASNLNDVNLPMTMELAGSLDLGLPPVHC